MGLPVDLSSRSPVRLISSGLLLREWDERDLPLMVELFDDPEIALRTPLPSPFGLVEAENRLAQARQPDRLLLAVTTDPARPLGEVLLTATGELGYMIGAQHRGQGLAAQALPLLRDYAHDTLRMAVLRLRIEPDNVRSATVAARAGFHLARAAAEAVENKGRRYTVDVWEHATT